MALIIGFIFIATYLVSPVSAATASYSIDFNSTSDLTGKFNPDSTPFFTNAFSGGISNSGAISISTNNEVGDIWTTKQGFSVPGTGKTYTISAFFNDKDNSGYGGLGFSNLTANEVDSYGSPAKGIGVIFHGGGGFFVNNRTNTAFSWSPDLNYPNRWYKMILEVTAKGNNIYDLKFQIWNSDANGNLGSMITGNTLNGVVNADLGGASEMYGYLSAKVLVGNGVLGRFANIDNFLIESESGADVSTSSITNITDDSAISGGDVTNEQGSTVTAKGVCWSTSTSPTIENDCTDDGSGLGTFTSELTGLTAGTTYYARAYATNSSGTSYGSENTFTTNTTSNSATSSSSNNTSSAPSCGDAKPSGVPDLFQIDVNDTHTTLYYTPFNSNISDYFISYSEASNTFHHGTLTGQGLSSGVLSYTVNFLQPSTTYYFKVRGQNGCMPGDFGNEMKITTRTHGITTLSKYYRYFTNLQGILESQ